MSEKIVYEGENQEKIGEAAAMIVNEIENNLPKVPWLSNSGQQEAFKKIIAIIDEKVSNLDADSDARNAVSFWVMALLYANSKSFQLATKSISNFGYAPTEVSNTFISWVGDNTHPGLIVMNNIESWRNK